jgi:hypothetical protein
MYLQYTLETFCEGRNTGYINEPYRGGPVDGPQNGPPPPPWAIPCQPNGMFDSHTKKMEVPCNRILVIHIAEIPSPDTPIR